MPVTAIRIADPHILKLIEEEQERAGEATPTKTAQRVIIERLAQRELVRVGVADLPNKSESVAA